MEVAMETHDVQVKQACEITAADLHDAYVFCRLRRMGIGMVKVHETPALEIALRNTAIAINKKKEQQQLERIKETT
jgi:hypothetical protein